MEVWRAQQEGLDVIIVNPGVILGPGFQEQGSGVLFTKVANGLSFYTMGTTGFVAVTDVVRISTELMKSEIKNERFTLIAQNIVFRDVLNTIADSLKVKKPSIHAKPALMEIAWRIDWLLSNVFLQKRKLPKATAKASFSKSLYSNDKIKNALKTDFQGIDHYIKKIANL